MAYFMAKQIASADMDEAVLLDKFVGLRALARAWRAEEYEINHRMFVSAKLESVLSSSIIFRTGF